MNRREWMQVISNRDDFAGRRDAVGGGSKQRELHRTSEREIEFAFDVDRHSLFMPSWNKTQCLRLASAFQPDVERMCGSPADPASLPAANQPVKSGASSNRKFQRIVFKQMKRARLGMP